MRFFFILMAAVCLAQSQQEKSAISGRVVSSATGAPLKKAAVWLEVFSPARGVNGSPGVSLPATTTDAEGRFTLDGIDPGSYLLLAQRTGYLDQGYGAPTPQIVGPPLDLGAGQAMREVTVKLTPQSLLYGTVVDEDGDPVPNAQVEVLRTSYAGGRRHLVEAGASASQDDGSFVVGNLTPGRYYLSAGVRKIDESGPPARKVERDKYVTTYFPNTSDAAAAAAVAVDPGAEVRGLAIRLRKSRVFSIRGRVVNAENGGPAASIGLQLRPKSEGLAGFSSIGVQTGPEGRFEFGDILPGTYSIETDPSRQVSVLNGEEEAVTVKVGAMLLGRAAIAVTDGDLEDVVIRAGQGATVTGTVTGAGSGRIGLVPAEGAPSHAAVAEIKPDGRFEIRHILPDSYSLEVASLPDGSYVKSVNFAGRPVDDWQLDLSSGAGGVLHIEVSPDAAEVSGVVHGASGDPSPGATVQLWPAGGDTARSIKADAHGEFHFRSLPPGDYLLAAWENLDDDLAQYAPFRARFAGNAARVRVAERARERLELKLIGRDAIEAVAAKLK